MTRVVIILSSDNIMTIVDHERFSDVLGNKDLYSPDKKNNFLCIHLAIGLTLEFRSCATPP